MLRATFVEARLFKYIYNLHLAVGLVKNGAHTIETELGDDDD